MNRSLSVSLLVLVGCATSHGADRSNSSNAPTTTDPAASASLYDRLGGLPAITTVVADFLQNVVADERINARFATADLADLQQKLIDQICQATGGPCHYQGRDMKAVHARLHVTNAEFDDLVGDLVKSLNTFHVPAREQSELLGALGGMRSQIVSAS